MKDELYPLQSRRSEVNLPISFSGLYNSEWELWDTLCAWKKSHKNIELWTYTQEYFLFC